MFWNRSCFSRVVLATVTAALLAGGCSSGGAGGFGGKEENASKRVISHAEMQQEYKDSVGKLAWPEGYAPPDAVPGEDETSSYQSGYGDSRASLLYECAWEKEWLDTYSSDSERAEKALSALEKVPSMGYMSPERADDATRRFFKDYLDRAKLGDPSGFKENVTNNCP